MAFFSSAPKWGLALAVLVCRARHPARGEEEKADPAATRE